MSPSDETWRAAMAHLDRLIEMPAADRKTELLKIEAEGAELLRRVRLLLRAHEEAANTGFLEISRGASNTAAREISAGARLGPYRVLHEIGSGGMGTVWLARRDDGHYDGEVAIKTLHAQLNGPAVLERFRHEAMLLGRLQHSNIARLLDAGSAEGVSYLVLEHVQGEPMEAWCDRRRLDIAARLRLFIKVCAAVAHAHANLVVHRDIKPGNILVTEAGEVKLLDFGIAKLLDSSPEHARTPVSDLTRLMGRALTPDYAAPEQIRGEAVTTATDVYSLGALLYVLLAGCRPFSAPDRPAVEVEHAALHDEPPPLARAARNGGDIVAENRGIPSRRLERELTGDLQHIVSLAMRKQPERRYESASALAEDVRRYLARVPVEARSGSWSYRTGRWISRHRLAMGMGTALLASAILGVVGVWWQAQEAQEQARIASREAHRAKAVSDFLLGVFNANSDAQPSGLHARQTTAEELLAIGGQQLLAAGAQDTEVLSELMGTLGMLHLKLEKFDEAEALFQRRIAAVKKDFGDQDTRLASAWLDLAELRIFQQRHGEARELAQKAQAQLRAQGEGESLEGARSEHLLGYTAYLTAEKLDDPAPARHFAREVAILERLPPSKQWVMGLLGLGKAQFSAGQHDEAVRTLSRALEVANSLGERDNMNAATAHQNLASVLMRLRRLNEAAPHQQRALEIVSRTYGEQNGLSAQLRMEIARLQLQQGRYLEAAENFRRGIPVRRRIYGEADMWARVGECGLAQALLGSGNFDGAGKTLDALAKALEDGSDQPLRGVVFRERASLRLEQGRPAEALADAERALALAPTAGGPRSLFMAQVQVTRADALAQLGRDGDASAALAIATGILTEDDSAAARPVAVAADLVLSRIGTDPAGAAHSALARIAQDELPDSLWALRDLALRRLADAQRKRGQTDAACQSLAAAVELRAARALPSDPRLVATRRQLAECGRQGPDPS